MGKNWNLNRDNSRYTGRCNNNRLPNSCWRDLRGEKSSATGDFGRSNNIVDVSISLLGTQVLFTPVIINVSPVVPWDSFI